MKKDFHVFSHIPTLRSGFALGVALLATSTAFATTHDLSSLEDALVAQDGDVLTGKLAKELQISIAAGATVTLNGVDINGDGAWKNILYGGITCFGDCKMILKGDNIVKGFYEDYPGIRIYEGYTLTIDGEGSLNTSSNGYGSGIGGGYDLSCGNIVIDGGSITANGGNFSAGIGAGYNASCGSIKVKGGNVKAVGGDNAAGIGSGLNNASTVECGAISISGGVVEATGTGWAAGIGLGQNDGIATLANIDISGGKIIATGGSYASASVGVGYNVGTVSVKSITIGGEETGYIVTSPFTYPSLVYVSEGMADGKTKAVIDGNFQGEDAINITEEIAVDNVVFNRAFSTSGYSTLMLPFDYVATNFENVEAIIEFAKMTTNDKGDPAIGMNFVWCSKNLEDALAKENPDNYEHCNSDGTKFPGNMTAYTPYMALMGDAELVFKEGATLATTASAVTVSHDGWTFKAPLQKKEFTEEDTKNGTIWGFAAKAKKGASIGKFVRFGSGAYVQPFRAYMESSSPLLVSASPNAQFAARPSVGSETASIESIDVVIVSRGDDGDKHTTTIGKFNTRTGEFQMLRNYDLKGRKVNSANRAQGAYYGKKVLKK